MVSVSGGQLAPINRFCRQYLQLESHLTYPDGSLLREEAVQEFLYQYLFAPGAVSYSPPPRYKLKVLKELVARIEEAIEDWDEHVSNRCVPPLAVHASQRHMSASGNIRRTYDGRIASYVGAASFRGNRGSAAMLRDLLSVAASGAGPSSLG